MASAKLVVNPYDFEKKVKEIASLKWGVQANPKNIGGVDFDLVLTPESGRIIIIEITIERNLDKVRTDTTRIANARLIMMSQGIFVEPYIILKDEPTSSMVELGNQQHIKILSFLDFQNLFYRYFDYVNLRNGMQFGSAIDPVSGSSDLKNYIPVGYVQKKTGKEYSITAIKGLLDKNHNIVLQGNYGSGKSRCCKELFGLYAGEESPKRYPIAINLRDHWGIKKAEELLRRHFDDLGLSKMADSAIKLLNSSALTIILDGFDELGSQAWSDNPNILNKIRRNALAGVKDLITKCNGSVILTGRAHYFDNDSEIIELLGLCESKTTFLNCKDEFSEEEFDKYLGQLKFGVTYPRWLPKRPLICQVISNLEEEELIELSANVGEIAFWHKLIQLIAERETKINPVLDSKAIYDVLMNLANLTRQKTDNVGPISIAEIHEIFRKVTLSPADDISAMMLQRLPSLGRISTENPDRQFVDFYIMDGLRADYVVECLKVYNKDILNEKWKNHLGELGTKIVADYIIKNDNLNCALAFFKNDVLDCKNEVLICDLLSSFIEASRLLEKPIDLNGAIVKGVHFKSLIFDYSNCLNFKIIHSIIDYMSLANFDHGNINLSDCTIGKVSGISSEAAKPVWIDDKCEILACDIIKNAKAIKSTNLSLSHKILITIIQRVFFQRGKARKLETLYRGYEPNKGKVDSVLKLLVEKKVVQKIPGGESYYIKPVAHQMNRVKCIVDKQSSCKDELWDKVEN